MTERWKKRRMVQTLLASQTGCTLQHTGWPCGSCFAKVTHDAELWHAVLVLRGDYKHGEHGIDMPDGRLSLAVDRLLAIVKQRVH